MQASSGSLRKLYVATPTLSPRHGSEEEAAAGASLAANAYAGSPAAAVRAAALSMKRREKVVGWVMPLSYAPIVCFEQPAGGMLKYATSEAPYAGSRLV